MNLPETSGSGTPHFHYSRAERLGYDPESEEKKKPQGIFQRNRSLAIILVDLVVILIIYLIYIFFLAPDASTARLGSFEFRLRAVQFGSDLLVTLAVQSHADAARPGIDGEEILELHLLSEDGTELLRVLETPPGPGEERVFREILSDYTALRQSGRVSAVVRVGERELRLRATVSAE